MYARLFVLLLIVSIATPVRAQIAVDESFTYQGRLKTDGVVVNTTCDFEFSLWDDVAGGNQVGPTLSFTNENAVPVINGLFTVPLNFGDEFQGHARWLQIRLRCPAGVGSFTTVSPRQELVGTPYALHALNAPWEDSLDGIAYDITDASVTVGTTQAIFNGRLVSDTDLGRAVVGRNNDTADEPAIYGLADNLDLGSVASGVYGETKGGNGAGVTGVVSPFTNPDGTARGVHGICDLINGWAGYFEGRGYFSDRVGIGTDSPINELHIHQPDKATIRVTSDTDRASIVLEGHGDRSTVTYRDNGDDFVVGNFNNTFAILRNDGNSSIKVAGDTGYVGILQGGLPSFELDVNGSIMANNFPLSSDRRLKRDITSIPDALQLIHHLDGVRFGWRHEEFPDRRLKAGRDLGFIAQDVQQVLPEAVFVREDGLYALDYTRIVPVNTEGIKALHRQVQDLQAQQQLQSEAIARLQSRLVELEKQGAER